MISSTELETKNCAFKRKEHGETTAQLIARIYRIITFINRFEKFIRAVKGPLAVISVANCEAE